MNPLLGGNIEKVRFLYLIYLNGVLSNTLSVAIENGRHFLLLTDNQTIVQNI